MAFAVEHEPSKSGNITKARTVEQLRQAITACELAI
jgi:hypothetical protein